MPKGAGRSASASSALKRYLLFVLQCMVELVPRQEPVPLGGDPVLLPPLAAVRFIFSPFSAPFSSIPFSSIPGREILRATALIVHRPVIEKKYVAWRSQPKQTAGKAVTQRGRAALMRNGVSPSLLEL